ncbi:MAG: hypothetical protein J6X79_03855 [Bacteroidales bacterium]|nr:hypothetical protein [Bacteroidales bacterium]
MTINVSLTTFMSYLNGSSYSKIKTVQKAKEESMVEYEPYKDYWFKFRNKVVSVHKAGFNEDNLRTVIDDVPDDRQMNYKTIVDGYCKFLNKRKKAVWRDPVQKKWVKGNLHVSINPEVCLEHKGKIYLIKLFIHINEKMSRKQADLITTLMRDSLGKKVPDNLVCCVLDVKKGTLYEEREDNPVIKALLDAEALGFAELWKQL